MDFTLSDEEQAINDLTGQILGDKSTHERLRDLTTNDDRVDAEAWAALAEAGVLGAAVPEEHGGLGLGYLATAMAMQQVGATASPVPLLPTTVMAAMPIAEFGTGAQKAAHLPSIADGSLIATAGLYEEGTVPSEPETVASADGDGYRLDGVKPMVEAGLDAGLLLIPARMVDGSCGVFLVDAEADGVHRIRVEVTTGRPMARAELTGVEVGADSLLGDGSTAGADIVEWIELRTQAAMCMMMAGAARASIELAAAYTKERQQFDRPIATFQAVSNRAGDSYIDTEAITLTAWQAAWRIDQGLPARDAVSIAKWWAADAGFRVVHAAVHVHGGVGVDRDYPLHRYFVMARQLELTLGNGEEHLAALGRSIAAS